MALRSTLIDYHVHSKFSVDGRSSIDDICRSAIRFGLKEIGFAEHVDFDPADSGYGFFDYEAYSSGIEEARRLLGDSLTIRKGVEIDYQSRFEEAIRRWLEGREFDFTIGSVHYVNGKLIDHTELSGEELNTLYPIYCSEVRQSITSGLFDVIGHFDLVDSFRQVPSSIRNPSIASVLEALVSTEASLEVNVRGFRKGRGDTVPGGEILRLFFEKGGRRISLGSDAHSAEEIGTGLYEAIAVIQKSNPEGSCRLFRK